MPLTYTTTTYEPNTLKLLTDEHVGVYAGKVLAEYYQTTRIMSDVWDRLYYALVWDNGPKVIGDPRNVTVDATQDVKDAYWTWYSDRVIQALKNKHISSASVPVPGKVVMVKHGRKDIGKVGKVVYMKDMPYSMGYRSTYLPKLCVALDGDTKQITGKYGKTFTRYTNTIWVWAKNVEVVDPDQPDMDVIRAKASDAADAAMVRLSSSWFDEFGGPTRIYAD